MGVENSTDQWLEIRKTREEIKALKDTLDVALCNLKNFHEYNESDFLDVDWFEEERAWLKETREKLGLDKSIRITVPVKSKENL